MQIVPSRRTLLTMLGVMLAGVSWTFAASLDKGTAERAVRQNYRQIEAAYQQKDAAGVFRFYAPNWKVTKDGNSSDLAHNRASLIDALGKLRSIQVTFTPEATDLLGDAFFVRLRKTNRIEFPLGKGGSTEEYNQDIWKLQNGTWRLVETQLLDNSVDQAVRAVEAQKKMMDWQDEQRRSQRCIGGVGYGCGGYR